MTYSASLSINLIMNDDRLPQQNTHRGVPYDAGPRSLGTQVCLIEYPRGTLRVSVASSSGGLALELPAVAGSRLAYERSCPPAGTAAVWLERGASARSSEIRSARRGPRRAMIGKDNAMTVMIGVDPHKRSRTAVAIDRDDVELAAIEVRSSQAQVAQLLAWADRFEARTWAVEGAGGVGYLLAQQLVGAGERVLDVPATLAARVRVLGSGRSNKNDANDGVAVAVAALPAPRLASVAPADHARACCVSWRGVTRSWAAPGPVRCAGCMRCSSSWCPAESPRNSRSIGPRC